MRKARYLVFTLGLLFLGYCSLNIALDNIFRAYVPLVPEYVIDSGIHLEDVSYKSVRFVFPLAIRCTDVEGFKVLKPSGQREKFLIEELQLSLRLIGEDTVQLLAGDYSREFPIDFKKGKETFKRGIDTILKEVATNHFSS